MVRDHLSPYHEIEPAIASKLHHVIVSAFVGWRPSRMHSMATKFKGERILLACLAQRRHISPNGRPSILRHRWYKVVDPAAVAYH